LPAASRCRSTAAAGATGGRSSISKFILSALLAGAAPGALAHGFGQRFDLPLPLWLWLAGAGATVVATFAVAGVLVKESARPERVFVLPPGLIAPLRLAAVLIFLLGLAAGFFGNQDPYRNLLPTVVWVLWWVGLAFVCALVADFWALLNPLDTLFRWAGSPSLRLAYPRWLGEWPAVALFFAFAWAELVWPDKDVPARLACAVLGYAVITWAGMFLYGRETWLARGEAFSLAFGLLARFAPLGLRQEGPVSSPYMVFVLLMLATVTFDGFLETPLMQRISTALHDTPALFALSELGIDPSQLVHSVLLVLFPLAFLAIFLLANGRGARAFVLTLVPIAVAYHLAHYFSLLLTAGQFIIPLASDPFGVGWDLFGTADYKVNLAVLNPYVFWYGAVLLIVLGHVLAVLQAHRLALRLFRDRRAALARQLPMMALMVAYTMLSLWILAQPIVS
jgi:hypothetical protein